MIRRPRRTSPGSRASTFFVAFLAQRVVSLAVRSEALLMAHRCMLLVDLLARGELGCLQRIYPMNSPISSPDNASTERFSSSTEQCSEGTNVDSDDGVGGMGGRILTTTVAQFAWRVFPAAGLLLCGVGHLRFKTKSIATAF